MGLVHCNLSNPALMQRFQNQGFCNKNTTPINIYLTGQMGVEIVFTKLEARRNEMKEQTLDLKIPVKNFAVDW